jgi:uncharacterized membrane protein
MLNKFLSILIGLLIFAALGMLIYSVANPTNNEKFSEFYLLGIHGKAADYPTNFTLQNGRLVSVAYGNNIVPISESYGRVTVGIVNREQQQTSYTIVMQIDGTPSYIVLQGRNVQILGPIVLTPGEQWQQEIGIIPQRVGNNQNVELFLYQNGSANAYLNLHLWINVTP